MAKVKEIKLHINPSLISKAKNSDGHLGEKCNNCGGFGFTMGLKGTILQCKICEQTGVKLPSLRELQTQISNLKKDLHLLKKALLETLLTKGITIGTNVKEANYV